MVLPSPTGKTGRAVVKVMRGCCQICPSDWGFLRKLEKRENCAKWPLLHLLMAGSEALEDLRPGMDWAVMRAARFGGIH